jgi:predicted nicotinamide N-methyase
MKAALPAGDIALVHGREVRACPYDWGSPIEEVTTQSVLLLDDDDNNKNEERRLFDIVVAADCIYIPELHSLLLDSIKMLMAEQGVALLPFALHGNTKDDSVWGIVELAKGKGFQVDILEPQQLTPQACNMESKRALVHMLRLTHQHMICDS